MVPTEEQRKYQRDYYRENRAKKLAMAIAYGNKHKDERKEYNARYYAANRDKIAVQVRGYRERTKEQAKARQIAYYAENKEVIKEKSRAWLANNPLKKQAQRLRKYGLTAEQYRDILDSQNGGCAICGKSKFSGKTSNARLHVDHCHVTGVVRGLLCQNCNHGIGKFKDDPSVVDAAAAYLRKYK